MMRAIYVPVRFKGARNEVVRRSLIDTGAEISLVPIDLARQVGAWCTNQTIGITGIHGHSRIVPLVKMGIFFPKLSGKGGYFLIAVGDTNEPLIGIDVLRLLGIEIDTRTGKLEVKNEIWEAFKTLSAVGVILFTGIKVLEKVFGEET